MCEILRCSSDGILSGGLMGYDLIDLQGAIPGVCQNGAVSIMNKVTRMAPQFPILSIVSII